MSLDEPFPLEHFPLRLQCAIRNEFGGRCPTQREVSGITDAQWLATPAIGPTILKRIRAMGQCSERPIPQMTDAELLQRLIDLQRELELIQRTVRMTTPRRSRESRPRHRLRTPSSDRRARSEDDVRTGMPIAD